VKGETKKILYKPFSLLRERVPIGERGYKKKE